MFRTASGEKEQLDRSEGAAGHLPGSIDQADLWPAGTQVDDQDILARVVDLPT